MKICFFPHYSFSNRDGATLSMYNIIGELLDRGHEVIVVLPNKNHLEEKLSDSRIEFLFEPMYSMRMSIDKLTPASRVKFELKYLHNQRCIPRIVRALRERHVDCIHINGLDSSVGAKVARELNIPYVWHVRAFIEDDLGKRLCHQKETYRLAGEANVVIGISKDIQKRFEDVLGRSVQVVYNGIPEENYVLPHHEIFVHDTVKLLLAGRISVQKGQMTAIKAMEILRDMGYRNLQLTLVGQGETKEYFCSVINYISAHGLDSVVDVKEHTDDLREMRKEHDIGLMCSKREAFGRVTVENMMAGMLVIGADSGGTPEIITDGVNGFLYRTEDPESLAQAVVRALSDLDRARKVAQVGYEQSIDRYSIKRVVDEVIDIYGKIV